MKKTLRNAVLIVVALLVAGAAFVYSGLYNIAADEHHWRITTVLMEMLRTRSIERRAQDIQVPPLDDPKLKLKGAGQYAEMCVMCHLAPGIKDSATREGLYPQPPVLSQRTIDPRAAFWVIKHGIKMTAMPAWGASHDDETLWSLVAFLQELPRLNGEQYQEIVRKAPRDEEMSNMRGLHGGPQQDHGTRTHSHSPHTSPHK